jgi:hypothetical protein
LITPRYGAYLVAAWLGGIIVNLLTLSGLTQMLRAGPTALLSQSTAVLARGL